MQRRLLPSVLALALLVMPGCRAADQQPLHWPTAPPPALQSVDPQLWIALAARLGRQPGSDPLQLRSAAGLMTLRDARGQRWRAPLFTLRWLRQTLPAPLQV